jgi:hypothetical protein
MIKSIEKSNGLIGNQTRDLPDCSIVPQPTTLRYQIMLHTDRGTVTVIIIGYRGRMGSNPASYLEGLWFRSLSGDRLISKEVFVVVGSEVISLVAMKIYIL